MGSSPSLRTQQHIGLGLVASKVGKEEGERMDPPKGERVVLVLCP
jgi:hypothetical protein